MVEQVAVLSDIHGVLPALEAVLAEPEVVAAQRIVVTGDMLAGPQPVEVFDRLAALGERAVWVRGNSEREMLAMRSGEPGPDIAEMRWAAAQLRGDQLERLAVLPTSVRLPVDGLGEVVFCHATPRDDEEVVLVDSRPERWAEVLSGLDGEVRTVVCGHTHMPFVRFTHGVTVVNAGSVGMPYGRPGASWALLGPGISLRHTAFDYDAAVRRITVESRYPNAGAWAQEYVRSRNTDLDALAAFGPRDGRDSGG